MLTTTVIPSMGHTPYRVDGNTVIIEDEFGNPLVVVMRVADKTTMITTYRDNDFQRILSSLGINKVVLDNNLAIDGPPQDAELLFNPQRQKQLITGAG